MFSGKDIPCVGISFGVDRIISVIKSKNAATLRAKDVDVYVMAFGGGKDFTGMLTQRMQVARQLWDGGIKAEFSYKVKPKLPQQFKAAETDGIPLAVILGEDEMAAGKVKLKVMGLSDDHPEKNGVLVKKEDLVEEVRRKLQDLPNSSTELPVR
jgi:histidyl-tRNA synthetase